MVRKPLLIRSRKIVKTSLKRINKYQISQQINPWRMDWLVLLPKTQDFKQLKDSLTSKVPQFLKTSESLITLRKLSCKLQDKVHTRTFRKLTKLLPDWKTQIKIRTLTMYNWSQLSFMSIASQWFQLHKTNSVSLSAARVPFHQTVNFISSFKISKLSKNPTSFRPALKRTKHRTRVAMWFKKLLLQAL